MSRPAWGCRPEEYSRKTPNLAKKKDIEGNSCLTKAKSTSNGALKRRSLTRRKFLKFEKFQTLGVGTVKKKRKGRKGKNQGAGKSSNHSHAPPMRQGHMFIIRRRGCFTFIIMGKNLGKRREVQTATTIHIPTFIQDSDDKRIKEATDE